VFELKRIVRFAVGNRTPHAPITPNGFSANPPMVGVGAHFELVIACRGMVGTHTGYLTDIKLIDRAARNAAVPLIEHAYSHNAHAEPGSILPQIIEGLSRELGALLWGVVWRLSPYYSVAMNVTDTRTVLLRQRFDFAAAHRLHNPSLSDSQNVALFGKCNWPSGHGHNYQVEPCVAIALGEGGEQRFSVRDLEAITGRVLIDRFDHKHLNLDAPEFASPGGINPTVENIARVFFDLLAPHVRSAGGVLRSLTVWETDRTSCTVEE